MEATSSPLKRRFKTAVAVLDKKARKKSKIGRKELPSSRKDRRRQRHDNKKKKTATFSKKKSKSKPKSERSICGLTPHAVEWILSGASILPLPNDDDHNDDSTTTSASSSCEQTQKKPRELVVRLRVSNPPLNNDDHHHQNEIPMMIPGILSDDTHQVNVLVLWNNGEITKDDDGDASYAYDWTVSLQGYVATSQQIPLLPEEEEDMSSSCLPPPHVVLTHFTIQQPSYPAASSIQSSSLKSFSSSASNYNLRILPNDKEGEQGATSTIGSFLAQRVPFLTNEELLGIEIPSLSTRTTRARKTISAAKTQNNNAKSILSECQSNPLQEHDTTVKHPEQTVADPTSAENEDQITNNISDHQEKQQDQQKPITIMLQTVSDFWARHAAMMILQYSSFPKGDKDQDRYDDNDNTNKENASANNHNSTDSETSGLDSEAPITKRPTEQAVQNYTNALGTFSLSQWDSIIKTDPVADDVPPLKDGGKEQDPKISLMSTQYKATLETVLLRSPPTTNNDDPSPSKDTMLTVSMLSKWHESLMHDLHPEAGKIRSSSSSTKNNIVLWTQLELFCQGLDSLYHRLQHNNILHIILFASVAMYGIIDIHPFADGNARLSRIVAHWALSLSSSHNGNEDADSGWPFCINFIANTMQRSKYALALMQTRHFLSLRSHGKASKHDWLLAMKHQSSSASSKQRVATTPFAPLVYFLLEQIHMAVLEFHRVWEEKSGWAVEESEARAARRVRERAQIHGTCLICWEDKPNIATLCCGKAVHLNCITKWLSSEDHASSCPVCRSEMPRCQSTTADDDYEVDDDDDDDDNEYQEDDGDDNDDDEAAYENPSLHNGLGNAVRAGIILRLLQGMERDEERDDDDDDDNDDNSTASNEQEEEEEEEEESDDDEEYDENHPYHGLDQAEAIGRAFLRQRRSAAREIELNTDDSDGDDEEYDEDYHDSDDDHHERLEFLRRRHIQQVREQRMERDRQAEDVSVVQSIEEMWRSLIGRGDEDSDSESSASFVPSDNGMMDSSSSSSGSSSSSSSSESSLSLLSEERAAVEDMEVPVENDRRGGGTSGAADGAAASSSIVYCDALYCRNRPAADCTNSLCGRCCVLGGEFHCPRHNHNNS